MSLPTGVAEILWQISQSTAQSLAEKLEHTLICSEDDAAVPMAKQHVGSNGGSPLHAMADYWQRQGKIEQQLQPHSQGSKDSELFGKIKQQELEYRYQKTQEILQRLQEWQGSNIQAKIEELPEIWQQDSWISQLSQQATRQILRSHAAQHRLLILTAPLKISKTCPLTFHEDLTIQLADELEIFFDRHYNPASNSPLTIPSPVEFYADYFPQPISKIHLCIVKQLFQAIPTAIIYTNINNDRLNCHVGFWTPFNDKIAFHPLPSWNWQQAKISLEASGLNPEKVMTAIQKIAIVLHQVLGGFIADWYYLKVNPLSEPRLLQLQNKFNEIYHETAIFPQWIEPYIHCLQRIQQQQRSTHQEQVAPQLSLEQIKSFRKTIVLTGHSSWVDSVAISQDGQTLVSGSYDNTIKLWDLSTGKSIHTLVGHSSSVYSVAMSPDKKIVVSGSDDGTIKLWNTATGELLHTLKDSSSPRDNATKIQSVAITPDGQKLVSGGDDRTVKIWHLETGELLQTLNGHSNTVEVVAIAPDNQTIVSGSDDGTLKIWQLDTGKLIRTIKGEFRAIYSLAIAPNSQTIVSGHVKKQIKIWQLETGVLVRTIHGNLGAVYAVAISPNNQILATADFLGQSLGHQTVVIQLWDMSTGQIIHTLPEHSNRVFSLCFSPDGKTLVSASENKTITIWQCE